ncbi:hypothetical protein PSCICN_08770 [Pseudomonas cichorii]|nr:hypothetical protein PSCICN_08770 [Pseudomonas cichorii]
MLIAITQDAILSPKGLILLHACDKPSLAAHSSISRTPARTTGLRHHIDIISSRDLRKFLQKLKKFRLSV